MQPCTEGGKGIAALPWQLSGSRAVGSGLAELHRHDVGTGQPARLPCAVADMAEQENKNSLWSRLQGLATFVGALADASVGVGIAVAIAMHNIPEGRSCCVACYWGIVMMRTMGALASWPRLTTIAAFACQNRHVCVLRSFDLAICQTEGTH